MPRYKDEVVMGKPKGINIPRYVGIGASAGGLEAIKEFFESTPSDLGVVWVIVQHLSPDYKSLMAELLSPSTEMEIHPAQAGVMPKADNIYLIPANTNLRLDAEGKFTLETQDRVDLRPNLPINIFFESLAELLGKDSIAVVLSGTGSDGTRGARAIREQGGVVLAQSLGSAKFDGMPKNIIDNDLADFVDTASKLPLHITKYIRLPLSSFQPLELEGEATLASGSLADIFALLQRQYRIDFATYKGSTISRRIERRMAKCHKASLDDYVQFLKKSPNEVELLFEELLIGVTSFYRDAIVFKKLQHDYLPKYLDQFDIGGEFRCWVAGCSTGEEAYTMAIILTEVFEARKMNVRIKVFATDISPPAIARATSRRYPKSIANDLPGDILWKYFTATRDHFIINRSVREKVMFARHDVINDPPFARMDLILCRNMLIYLHARAQHKVFTSFSFALKDDGLLLLGQSESLGEAQDLFEVLDKDSKLFSNIGRREAISMHMAYAKQSSRYELSPEDNYAVSRSTSSTSSLREEVRIYQSALEAVPEIGPVEFALLINNSNEVLRIIGTSKVFLIALTGSIDSSLKKLLCDPMQVPVNVALARAFNEAKPVKMRGLSVTIDGSERRINLSVYPLSAHRTIVSHALIVLSEEMGRKTTADDLDDSVGEEATRRFRELENELQLTRENLESTVEELQTSNEELQATNEELLAANEELQSTNEELQSVNEELYTINHEHQERIYQMGELRTEMASILGAAKISTILLDADLRITSFSPEAVRVFNLLEKDVGGSIGRVTHHFADLDLEQIAAKVQQSGEVYNEKFTLPRIGVYHLNFGPIEHQTADKVPGVAIVIQGPLD